MLRISSIKIPVCEVPLQEKELYFACARILRTDVSNIKKVTLYRRSVDARGRGDVHYVVTADVTVEQDETRLKKTCKSILNIAPEPTERDFIQRDTTSSRHIAVVGGGPAGLFAAYILALNGLHPILLERGRDVDNRTTDMERFHRSGLPDYSSNALFGEGGAGTFSDGKLHTGIKDSRCRFVLNTFVACGAPERILWDAQPHIGTDRLTGTIKSLREKIIALGGDVRFESLVTDIAVEHGGLRMLTVHDGRGDYTLPVDACILAVGHSARDTYSMLTARGVAAAPKAFAVGLRIEHPRVQIDAARYGDFAGIGDIGAASYKLVSHVGKRGCYTFCMCPGGEVITCVSEKNMLSVNGMSRLARNGENSNAALLVGISPEDYGGGIMDGIEFQRKLECAAFGVSGKYVPPAQLVGDFVANRSSLTLGDVVPSCRQGVMLCNLRELLPEYVATSIAAALPDFAQQIDGFDRYDAVLTGVEARSSSPLRLLRGEDMQSVNVHGLYPCGDGAGYAGGITSAAVDGIRCAEALIRLL